MGWPPPPLALGSSGALVVELMLVLLRLLHCWDCWPAIPRVSLAESLREDAEASTAEGTEDTPAAEAFITELEVVRSSAFGRPLVVTEAPPPILMSDTLGEYDFL